MGTLCDACRGRIERGRRARRGSIARFLPPLPIRALYLWVPRADQTDILGTWLRSLKGGTPRNEFTLIAQKMLLHWWGEITSAGARPPIIIPIPSHRPHTPDHALILARELGHSSGWQVMEQCLGRSGDQEMAQQKRLSRKARSAVHFRIEGGLPDLHRPILLVDDVVTSGATVLAAHRALRSPPRTFVWSIAYRERVRLDCAAPLGLL